MLKYFFKFKRSNVCLIVNVASEWGLTDKNYKQLQELYAKYQSQGLRILGFPCNQFGSQVKWTNVYFFCILKIRIKNN